MMNDIAQNIEKVLNEIPDNIQLVAVSKTKPVEVIKEAYDAGFRIFGENRVQELIEKQPQLPDDIRWHMIGHLQTNKVKYIASFVDMIESVDSLKLLNTINKEAEKANRQIDCLLQFHIAQEESKYGFRIEEVEEMLSSDILKQLPYIRLKGVMGMGTFTDDQNVLIAEFSYLKSLYDKLKENFFGSDSAFKEVSMGMSGDYKLAIREGSTMIRLGTSIFGRRSSCQIV